MKKENLNESGRSMVEMLGVLAIIAVLTVIGINGFRQAIVRHRANELLNEAGKRAAVVAGQLTMMGQATGNLNEFIQNDFGYGTFKTGTVTPQNGTFKIGIDNVPDDVCNQMQGMKGGAVIAITPCTTGDDNSILLTYNNDLSADENGNENSGGYARAPLPEDGPTADDGSTCTGERKGPCQVCKQGVYIDSDAICVAKGGGTCVDGTCKTQAGCMSNGDCKNIDPTKCGNGECYCNFGGNVDTCSGPTQTGRCLLKTTNLRGTSTIDGHTYVLASDWGNTQNSASKPLDWFSARNFCAAYNKRMMTISELGCEGVSTCTSADALYTKILNNLPDDWGWVSSWTSEVLNNCQARYVGSGKSVTAYNRALTTSNVICY